MTRGIVLLLLSLMLWLLLGTWVVAPGWMNWMESLWQILGRPGWVARLATTGLALFGLLAVSLRLSRSDS